MPACASLTMLIPVHVWRSSVMRCALRQVLFISVVLSDDCALMLDCWRLGLELELELFTN
jgi:hypothetical protein